MTMISRSHGIETRDMRHLETLMTIARWFGIGQLELQKVFGAYLNDLNDSDISDE